MKKPAFLLIALIAAIMQFCSHSPETVQKDSPKRIIFAQDDDCESVTIATFPVKPDIPVEKISKYVTENLSKAKGVQSLTFYKRYNAIIVKYAEEKMSLSRLLKSVEGTQYRNKLIDRDNIKYYKVTTPT